MKQNFREFPVFMYGKLEQYTDTISKCRCRVFYKGRNRNGSYITDEFAEKLISTIPYAPVKGIYEEIDGDYTGHGEKRDEGRIYGIVPFEPNFQWEEHQDNDGVTRTYACVDVLVYTALYKEAKEILSKGQSMEIYEKTMKGEWQIIDGIKSFVFTDGCFLGLQVLGDDVEPCFEGAAFFSLYKSMKDIVQKFEEYTTNFQKTQGGQSKMDRLNFKLSDNQKHWAIWDLLNVNYTEEGNWEISHEVLDIYDEYALAYNYEAGCYERVYYTKDDANDSVVLGEIKKAFVIDVTEEEKNALEVLHQLNGGHFSKVDETFSKVSTLEEEKNQFEQKIEEKDNTISTLETEKSEFSEKLEKTEAELSETKVSVSNLQAELDTLVEYKKGIELKEKEEVIAKYSKKLKNEILEAFSNELDKYTANELDKELAFALVNNSPEIFGASGLIPKDEPLTGLAALLSKHENK